MNIAVAQMAHGASSRSLRTTSSSRLTLTVTSRDGPIVSIDTSTRRDLALLTDAYSVTPQQRSNEASSWRLPWTYVRIAANCCAGLGSVCSARSRSDHACGTLPVPKSAGGAQRWIIRGSVDGRGVLSPGTALTERRHELALELREARSSNPSVGSPRRRSVAATAARGHSHHRKTHGTNRCGGANHHGGIGKALQSGGNSSRSRGDRTGHNRPDLALARRCQAAWPPASLAAREDLEPTAKRLHGPFAESRHDKRRDRRASDTTSTSCGSNCWPA